ncbi:metal-dependent hydrolase [Streptomyces sp. NPDC006207]
MTAEPEHLVLKPRDVHWDWDGLPVRYLDDDAFLTHFANVLNILLPEGEDWFLTVFQQTVPMIGDNRLREDVIGFIGQEAMHSRAHQSLLGHFNDAGLDTERFVAQLRWFFQEMLGDRGLTGRAAHGWLVERVAIIAAIEHVTSFLGDWILNAHALDALDKHEKAGAVLDLYRWHGAEEVEHRAVAYDLFTHLDGRYRHRVRAHLVAFPVLLYWWVRGLRCLMAEDPVGAGKPRWRDWYRGARRGLLPPPHAVVRLFFSYLRPGYHPSQYGSTTQAVAYLASSPAARAALH